MRSRRTALGWLTVALVSLAAVAQAGTPVEVVNTSADEFGSAAGGTWLAWSRGATYSGDHDLHVKQEGQPVDVVELGKFQQVGNIELAGPNGDILVFDFAPRGGDRDIRFYDLATGTVSVPPKGINTDKDDELVSISGDHLLFGRGPVGVSFAKRVYLYHFGTTELTLLAEAPQDGTVTPNSIRGDFASYTRCPSSGRCDVIRYQISTGDRIRMADAGRAVYWSSVMDDGTVYFVQGHPTLCGENTKIMRYRDGTTVKLIRFPDDIEIADLDAVPDTTDPLVYFTRLNCRTAGTGIWRITG